MHINTDFAKNNRLLALISVLLLTTLNTSCFLSGSNSIDFSTLQDVSTLQDNLSDTFFLDTVGLAKLSRTLSFKGTESECAHNGAHVHFTDTGEIYTVNLIAPTDGIIADIETCKNIGETDRYGIDLAIANDGSETIIFKFSIEPQDGTPCSDGDENFFAPYIFVTPGQSVSKGEVIGEFLKTANGSDAAHVHYSLGYNGTNDQDICPNIFNADVTASITALTEADSCSTEPPTSLCVQTNDDEMIFTDE